MPFGQVAANFLRKLRNCPPRARFAFSFSVKPTNYSAVVAGRSKCSVENGYGDYGRRGPHKDTFHWILMSGQAAIVLGMNASPALAEDSSVDLSSKNTSGSEIPYLQKIEDGSVVSNVHTSKWRVFTDTGRDLFLQRKLEEAETFFLAALQEAKNGFGERDPHVASACNNLAELYRVKKAFDKAEPLYLEAINILEESFGPDDIRVGAALHNLGQFYLVGGKLEQARVCYERSLKIKRRVLGEAHLDYADTMYHLGTVLYLEGKEKDAEALIWDSIRILEDAGRGESVTCLRRLQYLAKLQSLNALALLEETKIELLDSRGDNRPLLEAENILRECISTFKEFGAKGSLSSSPEVKAEYLSCLKHLFSVLIDEKPMKTDSLGELKDEIKRAEAELLASRKGRT